jgi:hypothetical protein
MLSGYTPEGHGLTWNDNLPGRGTIAVPTILSVAHDAGLRTVMVVGKEKMSQLNAPDSTDSYSYVTTGDQGVADEAAAQIQQGFDLMFVHLPNIDFFGHSTGWMSETYLFEISNTDSAVGRLLDALPENTTVILTADHGGHGTGHGSNIPEDMIIPWIIAGPNVAVDHLITSPVAAPDTAATAAYVLGLSLPADAVGQPVYEAFGQTAPDILHGAWQGGAAQTPARSEMPAAVLNGLIYVPALNCGSISRRFLKDGITSWPPPQTAKFTFSAGPPPVRGNRLPPPLSTTLQPPPGVKPPLCPNRACRAWP